MEVELDDIRDEIRENVMEMLAKSKGTDQLIAFMVKRLERKGWTKKVNELCKDFIIKQPNIAKLKIDKVITCVQPDSEKLLPKDMQPIMNAQLREFLEEYQTKLKEAEEEAAKKDAEEMEQENSS